MDTIDIKLPPAFVRDCIECDCDVGEYVVRTKTLTATREQIAELRSRAEHYAGEGLDAAPPGLIKSAKAAIAALDAAIGREFDLLEMARNEAAVRERRLLILRTGLDQ